MTPKAEVLLRTKVHPPERIIFRALGQAYPEPLVVLTGDEIGLKQGVLQVDDRKIFTELYKRLRALGSRSENKKRSSGSFAGITSSCAFTGRLSLMH